MAAVPPPKPPLTPTKGLQNLSDRLAKSGPPAPKGGPRGQCFIGPAPPERKREPGLQSPEQSCREHAPSAYSVSDCVQTKKQEALGLSAGHGGHPAHVESPHVEQETTFATVTHAGQPNETVVQNLSTGGPPVLPVQR
jgi:hypothetical protein